MAKQAGRTQHCSSGEARTRRSHARKFIEVAEIAAGELGPGSHGATRHCSSTRWKLSRTPRSSRSRRRRLRTSFVWKIGTGGCSTRWLKDNIEIATALNAGMVIASHNFARYVGDSEQPLHDQHVPPRSVELPVAAMEANRGEAASLDQAAAGGVIGEELPDQLVEAVLLSGGGERLGQRRAHAASPCVDRNVDAALADAGVTGAVAVRGKARPADDALASVTHQQREPRVIDPPLEIPGRPWLGLEGRAAFGNRGVVDGARSLGIAERCAAHNYSFDFGHARILGADCVSDNGRVAKAAYPAGQRTWNEPERR